MQRITGFTTLHLLLLLTQHSYQQGYQNNIYIDPVAGNDSSQCHLQNSSLTPCKSLHYAFEYRNDSTQYILKPGVVHELILNVPPFENLTQLAIVGEGASIISCTGEDIGLAFFNVSSISLVDVTFMFCAAIRNSTSRNYLVSEGFEMYQFQAALYFYLCRDVSMSRVNVSYSPEATGVVMYDTNGTNTIHNSAFTNNNVSDGSVGGGGFYVEFTYCVPGAQQCNNTAQQTESITGASFSFQDCFFTDNAASNAGAQNKSTYIVPYHSSHQAFGRGGGLSVFIKGEARANTVSVTGCVFAGNSAQWGGGLFVEFHDETASNVVTVFNNTFEGNKCSYTLDAGTGGGAMRLGHYVYNFFNESNYSGNRINVSSCTFTSNSAMYGGGLSISPTLQRTSSASIVFLTDLIFVNNTGKIGAALHVGLFPLITLGITMKVIVQECRFESNSALYAQLLGQEDTPHMIGVGAVYINNVPVYFQGENLFSDNTGSALAVSGVPVDFTASHIVFSRNAGYRGGAISLLGATYILIDNHTHLEFVDNLATEKGGAIYNKYIEMDNLMTQPNCFVRHQNPFLNPEDWNAKFVFSGNTDFKGGQNNSIHTSSILPCARAGGDGYTVDLNKLFCWDNWTYYDSEASRVADCFEQISSDTGKIKSTLKKMDDSIKHLVRVFPGQQFKLPFSITDDYNNDLINETVLSVSSNMTSDTSKYFWGGNAVLSGAESSSIELSLDTLGDRIWRITLQAELMSCPPGLKPSLNDQGEEDSNSVCQCSNEYLGAISCDQDTLKVTMKNHHWIGKLDGEDEYLVGFCPPGFCNVTNTSFISLPNTQDNQEIDLAEYICSSNREGIMCGRCMEGFGPSVNTQNYDCINCTDMSLTAKIAIYVSSVYLPLASLFVILIMFDIRLTTGPANAFILYAQVVSSTFSLDADGQVPLNRLTGSTHSYHALLNGYKVLYGVFNLEFIENLIPPLCFSSKFNALTVFLLDYGVAVFPLFMIIVIVVWLKLKECCSGATRSLQKRMIPRCRHLCDTSEALLPAFAAFILLSYTKFSLASSYIIGTQDLIDENGNSRKPSRVYYAGQLSSDNIVYQLLYLLPSSIVFAIFVCIPPILLFVYPLKAFEWCLSKVAFLWRRYPVDKVHFFLDTFQGCYRNSMRFFAGLYFLFRLVIHAIYLSTSSWLEQFVAQQIACVMMATLVAVCRPYNKENWLFNYVDALIFANLAIINALSFYLYTSTSDNSSAPSLSAFAFQYILVFLPLIYMLLYTVWHIVKSCVVQLKRTDGYFRTKNKAICCCPWMEERSFEPLNSIVEDDSYASTTKSEVGVDNLQQEEDEALFARAEVTNQFRASPNVKLEVYGHTPSSTFRHEDMKESGVSESPQDQEAAKKTNSTSGSKGVSSARNKDESQSHQ